MKRKIQILTLLTWYKNLKEEVAKLRFIDCKTELEKLIKEKEKIFSTTKDIYKNLENIRELSGEELKYALSKAENNTKFIEVLDKKIEIKRGESENLFKEFENAYKEKKK